MSNFDGSTKAQLAVATHQHIRRGRGVGVSEPETAVLFATSARTKELTICGRQFTNDIGSLFLY
jgi:hypothetical protein